MRTPGKFEHVARHVVIGGSDEGHHGRNVPHGERHIRVESIARRGDHASGLVSPHLLERIGMVQLAHHDLKTQVI
jgi:hypothetical protein